MAYTIDYAYGKILEAIDKDGSDFFSIPRVMKSFESATYDFIEEEYRRLGKTQKVTDSLKPLFKLIPGSSGNVIVYDSQLGIKITTFHLPTDYLHLLSIETISVANKHSRKVNVIPQGVLETRIANPNNRPTSIYPLLILLTNTMNFYTDSDTINFYIGYYLKKPTFGNVNGVTSSEIMVDLEDFAVEKIIKITANDLLLTIGDPRAIGKYRQEKEFGKI